MEKIPAENFVSTVKANVDNEKLSDAEFREFIRTTLPIVKSDEISERSLAMMDESMRNMAEGKVGKPIDLKELGT